MADEKYTFEAARVRLEEIAAEVRKKDTSLEKSLDLLEEGVRLANICTELVDHTDVGATVTAPVAEVAESDDENASAAEPEEAAVAEAAPEAAEEADDEAVDDADDEPAVDGFEDVDDDVDEPSDAGIED